MTSAFSAESVAAGALRFGNIVLDGEDVYWIESRPSEKGRSVVVRRRADGAIVDATPAGTSVRTRVHEFGGGPFAVADGVIYFSEFSDQRLYRLKPAGMPEPMTPAGAWRYADASVDTRRGRLVCVREDHTKTFSQKVVSTLVSLPLEGPLSPGEVVASGHDFYSTPRFSPDGTALAWLAWRHPQMPWDGTELWLAPVASDGRIDQPRLVAGSEQEAIFEPGWSPDGVLHFVSDRTGWWNLYRLRDGVIGPVHRVEVDCGRPQWTFGSATWAFCGSRLVVAEARSGRWTLNLGAAEGWEPGEYLTGNEHQLVFAGGSPTSPDAIVRVDARTNRAEAIRAAGPAMDASAISVAEAIEFPTANGAVARAFYYSPPAPYRPAPTARRPPPLIVTCHGGPTSATHARLNPEVQFWTSRGFAVVDVNYRGSTGFGRRYRESLNGQWGVADVEDCVNAARFLVSGNKADGRRLVIRGRSAGGFVVLRALTGFPDVFAAGAVYYGVADLNLLAHETHKFEERYLDGLIGPYPQAAGIYRDRSPINHIERLQCPLIVFQGLDDEVVPPAQSRAIVSAARGSGLPVEYLEFPGEGHGFRSAETIARCLEAEYNFFRTHLERA